MMYITPDQQIDELQALATTALALNEAADAFLKLAQVRNNVAASNQETLTEQEMAIHVEAMDELLAQSKLLVELRNAVDKYLQEKLKEYGVCL